MTANETPANVISLEEYRRRRLWPDPPRPGPIGGRKALEDALLAEVVVADAAEQIRSASIG